MVSARWSAKDAVPDHRIVIETDNGFGLH